MHLRSGFCGSTLMHWSMPDQLTSQNMSSRNHREAAELERKSTLVSAVARSLLLDLKLVLNCVYSSRRCRASFHDGIWRFLCIFRMPQLGSKLILGRVRRPQLPLQYRKEWRFWDNDQGARILSNDHAPSEFGDHHGQLDNHYSDRELHICS